MTDRVFGRYLCIHPQCLAGKHSGRNALKNRLQFLGFELPQDRLDDVFKRFKVSICNKKSQYQAHTFHDCCLSVAREDKVVPYSAALPCLGMQEVTVSRGLYSNYEPS